MGTHLHTQKLILNSGNASQNHRSPEAWPEAWYTSPQTLLRYNCCRHYYKIWLCSIKSHHVVIDLQRAGEIYSCLRFQSADLIGGEIKTADSQKIKRWDGYKTSPARERATPSLTGCAKRIYMSVGGSHPVLTAAKDVYWRCNPARNPVELRRNHSSKCGNGSAHTLT